MDRSSIGKIISTRDIDVAVLGTDTLDSGPSAGSNYNTAYQRSYIVNTTAATFSNINPLYDLPSITRGLDYVLSSYTSLYNDQVITNSHVAVDRTFDYTTGNYLTPVLNDPAAFGYATVVNGQVVWVPGYAFDSNDDVTYGNAQAAASAAGYSSGGGITLRDAYWINLPDLGGPDWYLEPHIAGRGQSGGGPEDYLNG